MIYRSKYGAGKNLATLPHLSCRFKQSNDISLVVLHTDAQEHDSHWRAFLQTTQIQCLNALFQTALQYFKAFEEVVNDRSTNYATLYQNSF